MKKVALILLITGFSFPGFAQSGVILELSGTVELKRSPDSPWVKAAAGMSLDRDMSISTGFRSTALISLGSSRITVQPLTRISLEELAASDGTENAALFLRAGRVRAEVNPPAGGGTLDFQVRSPSVTASVRGTEFNMDASKVKMISGTVAFAGSDGVPVMVGAGQSASAEAGGPVVSADLSPALPSGIRSGRRAPAAAPAGGTLTGTLGWYGETSAGD
jgi:hypothetical protein